MWSLLASRFQKRRRTEPARTEVWYEAREVRWQKRDSRHESENVQAYHAPVRR